MRLAVLSLLLLAGCASAPSAGEQWTPLFNGRDLSGWMGDTEGYTVQDGVMVAKHGTRGNLYTDRPYSDFVLRFQFRLDSAANNGVGIRAEPGKDAAYYGMEVQMIDDYAAKWANIQPWQKHGSIYGVVAARTGALRPAGQWNEQEIRAEGDRITVTLNGQTIVDADIRAASASGTLDGKAHPGLLNPSGHIGFLGHGDRVEIREVRIRELR